VYKLLLHPNIEKKLQKIPRDFATQLAEVMRDLRADPRPEGSIQIGRDIYRLREGDYRIIYVVFDNDKTIFVGKVVRRSEKTYRDINKLIRIARLYLEQEKLKK
jgi:mRNA interferase RelE/StbE